MEQMEMEAGTEAKLEIERAAARQQAHTAHQHHRQGTVAGCILCEDVAYEPGWYALLASFARNSQNPTITLPNAVVVQI